MNDDRSRPMSGPVVARTWFIASIVTNVVLAATAIVTVADQSSVEVADLAPSATIAPTRATASDGAEPVSARQRLAVAPEEQDKLAYLAVAEYVNRATVTDENSAYWQPPTLLAADAIEKELTSSEAIRAALLRQYGRSAITEPVFAKYFFPLGAAFGFLSSDKQIAISRLSAEARLSMASSNSEVSLEGIRGSDQRYLDSVRSLLTGEEFLEFQLRESRLARQLRSLDIGWDEAAFRAVYALRSKEAEENTLRPGLSLLDATGPSSLYDRRVEAILGADRYADYLKAQDPVYRRMQTIAANSGRSGNELAQAYEQYVDASHEAADLRLSGNRQSAEERLKQRDRALGSEWGAALAGGAHYRVPSELSGFLLDAR